MWGIKKQHDRYFLVTTTYFLYGESVIYYFQQVVLVDRVLLPFATHHRFISFILYVIGNTLSRESVFNACRIYHFMK